MAWKFNEVALTLKERKDRGEKSVIEAVVFDDVYPLYGQTDIKGSSEERNRAIQSDLVEQLRLLEKFLVAVLDVSPLPIYEELLFRLRKHMSAIRIGLSAGDEINVLEFVRNEIEVLFNQAFASESKVKESIETYKQALDPELKMVYRCRKSFEQSLTQINEAVSLLLDREEAQAQEMFPHYFEKYKTDGVEFNMYIGESLVPDRHFDPIYLKNLRLWQLEVMCEITRLTGSLKPALKIPLSTTQLILVHSAPLSIRFRQEEKKFDVDGAYNIRYEIVKKRIDKARIKGKSERLTQPGKIAIVYSNDREVQEYKLYIDFLQHKGLLDEEVEYLTLEELPGTNGLKALRVKVKQPQKNDSQSIRHKTNKVLPI
ncbi:MAG: hypothetical protein HC880_13010 [Bacteroidia bacterium]|nr:hypothetical protein [Bacteroidia bacterium]